MAVRIIIKAAWYIIYTVGLSSRKPELGDAKNRDERNGAFDEMHRLFSHLRLTFVGLKVNRVV